MSIKVLNGTIAGPIWRDVLWLQPEEIIIDSTLISLGDCLDISVVIVIASFDWNLTGYKPFFQEIRNLLKEILHRLFDMAIGFWSQHNSIGKLVEFVGNDNIIVQIKGGNKLETMESVFQGQLNEKAHILIRVRSNKRYNSLFTFDNDTDDMKF